MFVATQTFIGKGGIKYKPLYLTVNGTWGTDIADAKMLTDVEVRATFFTRSAGFAYDFVPVDDPKSKINSRKVLVVAGRKPEGYDVTLCFCNGKTIDHNELVGKRFRVLSASENSGIHLQELS